MTISKRSHVAFLIGGLVLAGCATHTAGPKDYIPTCRSETGAKGSYVKSAGQIGPNGLATILPADGADARGALLMNACNEQHHKEAGTLPKVSSPKESVMMADGKLSLPQKYTLSPEDKALWPTLTLEQQKRALLFLKSGSTIQSSLQGDQ